MHVWECLCVCVCVCVFALVSLPGVGHGDSGGKKSDQPDADYQPSKENHCPGGSQAPMGLRKCTSIQHPAVNISPTPSPPRLVLQQFVKSSNSELVKHLPKAAKYQHHLLPNMRSTVDVGCRIAGERTQSRGRALSLLPLWTNTSARKRADIVYVRFIYLRRFIPLKDAGNNK